MICVLSASVSGSAGELSSFVPAPRMVTVMLLTKLGIAVAT